MPFVEPVGLAELTDDVLPLILSFEDELAYVCDLADECLPCSPVGVDEVVDIECKGRVVGRYELSEVELPLWVAPTINAPTPGPRTERRPTRFAKDVSLQIGHCGLQIVNCYWAILIFNDRFAMVNSQYHSQACTLCHAP